MSYYQIFFGGLGDLKRILEIKIDKDFMSVLMHTHVQLHFFGFPSNVLLNAGWTFGVDGCAVPHILILSFKCQW